MPHRTAGPFFIVLAVGGLFAALSASAFGPFGQADIKVDTTLVVIPVTVTDAQNRFVLGLEKNDFTLSEDNVEQKVTQFAGENAPISAGLLVDTSGSMGAKIDISRDAVTQFLKTMDLHDEACLIEFGDRAQVIADFSKDIELLRSKLSTIEPQGLTALLDAVSLGLQEMHQARNTRKALIIISDGGDNNSRYSQAEIKDLVRQADVQVYSMGVFERFPMLALSIAEASGPKLLAQLSDQTGGRVFSASNSTDLPAIAARIGIELRNQYVLAYVPSNRKKDGKYRHVEVKVKAAPGLSAFKVRWRLGYYAPTQ
ncbi:MAG TPA: VWA domain-containing protein [Bryobacteraceae bacterium]|jgi:Ca-activated chloride channel family protein|nr:VWA domain-containing protein [Bryobacteraceae bacterium]